MNRRSTTLCLLGLFLVSLVLRLVAWRLVPAAQHDNESMEICIRLFRSASGCRPAQDT